MTLRLMNAYEIKPSMTDREGAELAYGLLWMVGCDRSTKAGEALYLARKALYEKMDRAGQARGITAAREALGTDHISFGERSDAYRLSPSIPSQHSKTETEGRT